MLKGEQQGGDPDELSELERDALGEIANISMGTAATTMSSLLGKRVEITTPRVKLTSRSQIRMDYPKPYLVATVKYTSGLSGENLLVMKVPDAAVIVDLMMGGDGSSPPGELNELHLSAVGEAMNQMMGSAATSMSTIFKKAVNISPPSLRLVNLAEEELKELDNGEERLVQINFKMFIEDLIDSEMLQIVPIKFAREMSRGLLGQLEEPPARGEAAPVTAETGITPEAGPAPEPAPQAAPEEPPRPQPQEEPPRPQPPEQRPGAVTVQPVQFTSFENATAQPQETANLNLILDVPLQFAVELGRTRKSIKEILDLGPGSIVELDKLAGEPVDILVNGKNIARGEVVVIDENYGVRITEILSSTERINKLQ